MCNMKILAIDPGYERVGIAVLEKTTNGSGGEELVYSDCFKTSKELPFLERLQLVGEELERVIKELEPTAFAIEKLFFIRAKEALPATGLTIPPGAQVHPNGKIFSNIDLGHVETILRTNKDRLDHENQELLDHARAVISRPNGVNRVHIIDGRKEGRILQEVFTSVGGGTMIYGNRYAHIRQALLEDVPEILHLMDGYVQQGNLVMRTDMDIKNQIENYYIYEVDQAIYGCGALYELGHGWGEIGAIAVNPAYKSKGVGRGIMQYLIEKAHEKELKTLFLLTTKAADWFFEFGFTQGHPEDLPEHRKNNYNMKRNSRVLLLALSQPA